MDREMIKWLNMVWGALDEQDDGKRGEMLDHAKSFLEETRELHETSAIHQ